MNDHDEPIQRYEYKRIRDHGRIRILTVLQTDDHNDSLKCIMNEHSLSEKPEYFALSYVWGGSKDHGPLKVGGGILNVQLNVLNFLRKLSREGTFKIWIDAICINQDDLPERASQVKFMRDIYGAAKTVIVHLQEADDWKEANRLFNCLLQAAKSEDSIQSRIFEVLARNGLPERRSSLWEPLWRLFGNPWFQRFWTFQECFVSKNCIIMHGDQTFDLQEIFKMIMLMNQYRVIRDCDAGGMRGIIGPMTKSAMRCELILSQKHFTPNLGYTWIRQPLVWLLRSMFQGKATRPCDRVFSLVGVSNEYEDPLLQPQYGPDEERIFFRVAEHAVRTGAGPLLLDCVSNKHDLKNWPSWIPRWDIEEVQATFVRWVDSINPFFNATAGSEQQFRYESEGQTHILAVRAIVLDSLAFVDKSTQSLLEKEIDNNRREIEQVHHMVLTKLFTFHFYLQQGIRKRWHFPKELLINLLYRFAVCDQYFNRPQNAPFGYKIGLLRMLYLYMQVFLREWLRDAALSDFNRQSIIRIADIMQGCPFPHWVRFQSCQQHYKNFTEAACNSLVRLDWFYTQEGRYGLAHSQADVEDRIALIAGCEVPILLRPQLGGRFSVLGPCYVHGIMYGEAWEGEQVQNVPIV